MNHGPINPNQSPAEQALNATGAAREAAAHDAELASVSTLLVMAREADGFAAACEPGVRGGVFTARRLMGLAGVFGVLAAAAAVAIVAGPAFLWSGPAGAGSGDLGAQASAAAGRARGPEGVMVVPRPGEGAARAVVPVAAGAVLASSRPAARDIPMPASGDVTVLLAVFGDAPGTHRAADAGADEDSGHDADHAIVLAALDPAANAGCGCTVFAPVAWSDDRPLAEIGRGELISAALARRCGGAGELQFVLAIQGPVGSLPATAEAARSLVACVASGPEACADEGNCFAAAALRCVPEGVDVLAETMQVAAR